MTFFFPAFLFIYFAEMDLVQQGPMSKVSSAFWSFDEADDNPML